jgi:hypothetical protein
VLLIVAPTDAASSSMWLCILADAIASLTPSRVTFLTPAAARNSEARARSPGNSSATAPNLGSNVHRLSGTVWRAA